MAAADAQAVLRVPARDVPVPSFLSPQAQAILGMGLLQVDEYPALEDLDGWRAMVASRDEVVRSIMADRVSAFDGEVEEIDCDGTRIFVIAPAGMSDEDRASTSTSTVAASSWVAVISVERWASERPAALDGGPGPSTTGCRPTFPIRQLSTTRSLPTEHCSTFVGQNRSSWAEHRRVATSLPH